MNLFFPFLVSGIGIGAIYALSGAGLIILFRATGVLNFALGGIGAIGAFVAWQILDMDLPLALAVFGAVAISTLISFSYGRYLSPLLSGRDRVVRAVGTLALALVLIGAMGVIWGEVPRRLTLPTDRMFIAIAGVRLTYTRLIALALTLIMVGGVSLLLNRTRLGLDMRALADDRHLSALLGVRVRRTETAAWVITGIFAGFAGLLLGDLVRLQGSFLTFLVIPAVAAAILGQLRSLWITTIAGFGIGITEALLTPVAGISSYRAATPFLVALVVVFILGSTAHAVMKDR